MSRAKGITQSFEAAQVAGIDKRVWQDKGTSTDNRGVQFTLKGEVATTPGIRPLVWWKNTKETGYNPFGANQITSMGVFSRDGVTDLLFEFDGKLCIARGNKFDVLAENRYVPPNLSESTRFIQVANNLIITNGRDPNLKWDGEKLTPLGIDSSPPAPTIMESSPGDGEIHCWNEASSFWGGYSILKTDTDRTYRYKTSWVSEFGQESELSEASNSVSDSNVTVDRRYLIQLTGLEAPVPQDDIIGRNIYRSTDGLTYYLLRYLPGTDGESFLDSTAPDAPFTDTAAEPGTNSPPPLSKFAFYFRGRTYYGGNPENQNTLFYSGKDGAKEAVAPDDFVIIGNNIAEPLTGFALAGDFVLLFKERSTYMLTQDKEGLPIVTPVSTSVGAVSDKAAVGFGGRVFFVSVSGLYAFDGSKVVPVSPDIADIIKRLPSAYLKNSFSWADPIGRRVYFSIASGPKSHNNEVWALHVDNGALSKVDVSTSAAVSYKGNHLVAYNSKSDNSGVNDIGVWGTGTKVYYREGHVSTLKSVSMDRSFETRWLFGSSPQSDKTFTRIDVFYVQTGGYQVGDPSMLTKSFDNRVYVEWCTDWDRNIVGGETLTPADPDALLWDEANENGPLTWSQVEGGPSGLGSFRKLWDEKRVRCARINIAVTDRVNPDSPVPLVTPKTDPSGSNITAKSIKFSFSTGGDAGWRIVGFLLHMEDHGVRSEGTDHE
mgnify:CR=1 FL=1|tara:strand:- start:2589 stop:4730 length:2142 start_codon:yes stop_codon:yes gene_type:complete